MERLRPSIICWRTCGEIREVFEAKGFLIQQWDKVQTDLLTIIPNTSILSMAPEGVVATE